MTLLNQSKWIPFMWEYKQPRQIIHIASIHARCLLHAHVFVLVGTDLHSVGGMSLYKNKKTIPALNIPTLDWLHQYC